MPAGQIVMCLPIQRVHLSIKQPKSLTFWAKRAKLNASAGHTWPAGRMLCMPALECHVLFDWPLTHHHTKIHRDKETHAKKFGMKAKCLLNSTGENSWLCLTFKLDAFSFSMFSVCVLKHWWS